MALSLAGSNSSKYVGATGLTDWRTEPSCVTMRGGGGGRLVSTSAPSPVGGGTLMPAFASAGAMPAAAVAGGTTGATGSGVGTTGGGATIVVGVGTTGVGSGTVVGVGGTGCTAATTDRKSTRLN